MRHERLIFLVDMNAFYISCEIARHPHLGTTPSAVAGDPKRRAGIILAANYPARALGIRTAMTLHEALMICPTLECVAPDHGYYRAISEKVMAILRSYSPIWEPNSIDEAWLDMTEHVGTGEDPAEVAQRIMMSIRAEVGIGCSIGIGPNKYLAKMAADMKKPNGITVLTLADVPTRLWPLPIHKLHGVGGQTAKRLMDLGIRTVGDVTRLSPDYLETILGKHGRLLWGHAHGEGSDHVATPDPDDVKSISRETTVSSDITDPERACAVLKPLSTDVAARAKHHRKLGRTVTLTMKDAVSFKRISRQASLSPTDDPEVIYRTVCALVHANWHPDLALRLIGVGLTHFDPDTEGPTQLDLDTLLSAPKPSPAPKVDPTKLGIPGLIRASDLKRPRKESS